MHGRLSPAPATRGLRSLLLRNGSHLMWTFASTRTATALVHLTTNTQSFYLQHSKCPITQKILFRPSSLNSWSVLPLLLLLPNPTLAMTLYCRRCGFLPSLSPPPSHHSPLPPLLAAAAATAADAERAADDEDGQHQDTHHRTKHQQEQCHKLSLWTDMKMKKEGAK